MSFILPVFYSYWHIFYSIHTLTTECVREFPPCFPEINPRDILQKYRQLKENWLKKTQTQFKGSKETKSANNGIKIQMAHGWSYGK